MPVKPQTVFRTRLAASTIDLRKAPWVADRARWTDPVDYAACQALARVARARVQAIRANRSATRLGGCAALLDPAGFAKPIRSSSRRGCCPVRASACAGRARTR
jgi:hypothetical protein